jgi:hypothetical protein
MAFAMCPFLSAVGIAAIQQLVSTSELPPRSSLDFVVIVLLLVLFLGSFLLFSFISAVAGRDLWKLRNRGRRLATLSMVLWVLAGILMAILGWNPMDLRLLVGAAGVCVLGSGFLIYLQLPSARSRFIS